MDDYLFNYSGYLIPAIWWLKVINMNNIINIINIRNIRNIRNVIFNGVIFHICYISLCSEGGIKSQ